LLHALATLLSILLNVLHFQSQLLAAGYVFQHLSVRCRHSSRKLFIQ